MWLARLGGGGGGQGRKEYGLEGNYNHIRM